MSCCQKPAHTEQTLVDDYLGESSRGNNNKYRCVVADAPRDRVAKARALAPLMAALSTAEVAPAHDPALASEIHRCPTAMFAGCCRARWTAVMNACIDNQHGHTVTLVNPVGHHVHKLSCPCARALPRHLPVQTLVLDRLT